MSISGSSAYKPSTAFGLEPGVNANSNGTTTSTATSTSSMPLSQDYVVPSSGTGTTSGNSSTATDQVLLEMLMLIEQLLKELLGSDDTDTDDTDDDDGDVDADSDSASPQEDYVQPTSGTGSTSSTPSSTSGTGSSSSSPSSTSGSGTTASGASSTTPVSLSTSISSDSDAAAKAKQIMNDPTQMANNPLPQNMANRNEIYAAAVAQGVDPTFLAKQAEDESSDQVGQSSASDDPEQTPGLIQASNEGGSFGTGDEALNEALEGAKEDRQSVVGAEQAGYSGQQAEVAGVNAYNSGSYTQGWADAGDPRFPRSADNYYDAVMGQNLAQDVSGG